MRLDIKNNTSYPDAPVHDIWNAIGIQIWHVCRRWPGANHVVDDLIASGFYLELVDDIPEVKGALGYHDVDKEGRPFSRIGVNVSLKHGSDWLTGDYSVVSVVGHEAIETIGNPIVNIWRDIDGTSSTAQELCDAVEDSQYKHNGMDLTNFLLPSWFNPWGKAPFDFLGALEAPYSMTSGGYMIVMTDGQVNQQYGAGGQPAYKQNAHHRAKLMGV